VSHKYFDISLKVLDSFLMGFNTRDFPKIFPMHHVTHLSRYGPTHPQPGQSHVCSGPGGPSTIDIARPSAAAQADRRPFTSTVDCRHSHIDRRSSAAAQADRRPFTVDCRHSTVAQSTLDSHTVTRQSHSRQSHVAQSTVER
jgi:hypothetical protein